jgi:putative ABC transport system permease protein
MNPWMTLQLSFRSLLRNKVRTALTMLGIVIGIASVIAMVAIGQGASALIQDQINSMGRNLLMIRPGAASSSGFSWGAGTIQTLTREDGDAIAKEVASVRAVAPAVRARAQAVYGSLNWTPQTIQGTSPSFMEVRDWDIDEGAFFTDQDVLSVSKVCVLGRTVAEKLFQGMSPVGETIRIKNMPFRVVGILAKKGTSAMGSDQDDIILLPWTTVKRALQGSAFNNVEVLYVTAVSAPAMADAMQEITALLRQRHRTPAGEDSDFQIQAMTEMAAAVTQTSKVMTLLLAFIASVSLVVGGIGIMNIMLVSVVERTREIGLRMAVGARKRDILFQFLTEAIVLCITAGIVGMALGVLAAFLISQTLKWPSLISPASIGIAFGFSCAVGVFFGFYPAFRASRLDPIEALRYE